MQRMRFPGIGIGVEPVRRLEFHKRGKDPSYGEKNKWSYGEHRSFLVAWGLLRARQAGVVAASPTYVGDCLLHIESLFEDEGISLQKGHKLMRQA